MVTMKHIARWFLLAAACGTMAACRSGRVEEAAATSGPRPYLVPRHGTVVRVNPRDRYVVLECTHLPIPGEVITLYREERVSANVRAGRVASDRYVAADIIEGEPMAGDWFRRTPMTP